ncbi:MAG TPA: hypothetical protein VEB64_16535 [Azospirillaceae bacterium]|nr:hypothetical protein [Azospirillaceae bacterium]
MIRKTLLAAAAAALLAGPVAAGEPRTGGVPLGMHNLTARNMAAGAHNKSYQDVMSLHRGAPAFGKEKPGQPLVSTRVNTALGVAAGVGNTSGQNFSSTDTGGTRGSLVDTEVNTGLNLSAGIGNDAFQNMFIMR